MVGLLCALSQYRIISKPLKSEMKNGERDLEQLSTSKIIVRIFEDNNEALTEKKRALVADIAEANIAEVDHISGLLKDVLREKEHLEKEYQCYANNGATMTSEDGQHLKHLCATILRFVRIASEICIIRVCTDENLLGPLLERFNQLC
ncbi:hypothetical protein MAR_032930 [Mya arenaria]|uniref:Uncharacterized protein n=1 Tax=Mya arenaria TaxID=6604 RepID=A0ABY7G7K5_MYAAR|nr:hypothetical protein MAR_032930 [Mya arenaria]